MSMSAFELFKNAQDNYISPCLQGCRSKAPYKASAGEDV